MGERSRDSRVRSRESGGCHVTAGSTNGERAWEFAPVYVVSVQLLILSVFTHSRLGFSCDLGVAKWFLTGQPIT